MDPHSSELSSSVINLLKELAPLATAIIVMASEVRKRSRRSKPPNAKKTEANKSSHSQAEMILQKQGRQRRRIRMSVSFIALAYLIFCQLGPARKQPATVGDVAGLAMVAALYVVAMLDRS